MRWALSRSYRGRRLLPFRILRRRPAPPRIRRHLCPTVLDFLRGSAPEPARPVCLAPGHWKAKPALAPTTASWW
ncbi:hypothetical protein BRADI_2g20123v3 [Brachypodium distachyon]|uniref:Uncharacterized protein n=1 Tax=Brachypodium distachyon TaxID=15368 RepID=A0A0Q3IHW6_BRADI|nr:hypothetical protein BRADI_2g20123v3 [Brachypodium distachyon]